MMKISPTPIFISLLLLSGCSRKHPSRQTEAAAPAGEEVLILCGGSMRAALEDVKSAYAKISNDVILTSYGDSGELCAQIENTGKGDLYICHDPFMPWAAERDLISEWETLGVMNVVLVVPRGNPKNLKNLADLARPGIRLGIGSITHSTAGQITNHILNHHPLGKRIRKNIVLETKGHQQRCNDVIIGTLDAALVWDAVAQLYGNKLEIIPVDFSKFPPISSATYNRSDLNNIKVTIGIIEGAGSREAVRRFYSYITTGEGRRIFQAHGFSAPPPAGR